MWAKIRYCGYYISCINQHKLLLSTTTHKAQGRTVSSPVLCSSKSFPLLAFACGCLQVPLCHPVPGSGGGRCSSWLLCIWPRQHPRLLPQQAPDEATHLLPPPCWTHAQAGWKHSHTHPAGTPFILNIQSCIHSIYIQYCIVFSGTDPALFIIKKIHN